MILIKFGADLSWPISMILDSSSSNDNPNGAQTFFSIEIENAVCKEEERRATLVKQFQEASKNWKSASINFSTESVSVNFVSKELGGVPLLQYAMSHITDKIKRKQICKILIRQGAIINSSFTAKPSVIDVPQELLKYITYENVCDIFGCVINFDDYGLFFIPNWIQKMSSISELSLENNSLFFLPYSLVMNNNNNFKKLNLKKNPFSSIPPEIREKLYEGSLGQYRLHFKKPNQSEYWNNIDFVMIGEPKGGKTSLIQSLRSKNVLDDQNITHFTWQNDSETFNFRTFDFEQKDITCTYLFFFSIFFFLIYLSQKKISANIQTLFLT